MNEHEQKIRELIERVTRPDAGVSPEFSILSVADAVLLLETISALRETVRVLGVPVEDADRLRRKLCMPTDATFAEIVKEAIAYVRDASP